MFALTWPQRLANLCSAIRATLGQRQIRQSPGLALNAHSGNEWGKIPVLTGITLTSNAKLENTNKDQFLQAPCGRPHRKLKLESTDVFLSSFHAKKLVHMYSFY